MRFHDAWAWAESFPALGQAWRAPLAAIIAAALLVAVGRLARIRWMLAGAPGLALFAGWMAGAGLPGAPPAATRLPFLALGGVLLGVLADRAVPRQGLAAIPWVLAAFCGWWMAGLPRDLATTSASLMVAGAAGLYQLAVLRLLTRPEWNAPAAFVAFCAGLLAVGAAPLWVALALVPLGATAGLFGGMAGAVRWLPLAAGLAGVPVAAVIGAGRLAHGGLGRMELAATVPPLVLWLAARIPAERAGLAAALAALLGVAACWGMAILTGLR